MEGAEVAMMEMNAEATWKVMENLLKHGKYNIVTRNAMENAVRLLKQESVKPQYNARKNWYECGSCTYAMTSGIHCRGEIVPAYKVNFCANCGKAADWR